MSKIRQEIKDLQFATCPTEEAEPFFWKWNEHGLDVLEEYVLATIKEIKKELKKHPVHDICFDCKEGFRQNLIDKILINSHSVKEGKFIWQKDVINLILAE